MASSSRSAYKGNRRKIVLAFDLGTTYSGISYSILDPGRCPTIHAVTRFPAQEIIEGASKIPSVVYYDNEERVKAIGAEAMKDDIYEAAIEGGWYKAEWFKLHLRSKYTGNNTQVSETKEFTLQCWYFDTAFVKRSIKCYRGSQENPEWMDTDPANFTTVCTLTADMSQIPRTKRRNPVTGGIHYVIMYDLVLIFGLTELQAQVRWFDDGVERRSPAQMIYDDV